MLMGAAKLIDNPNAPSALRDVMQTFAEKVAARQAADLAKQS